MSSISNTASYDSSTLKTLSEIRSESSISTRSSSGSTGTASGNADASEISDEGYQLKSFMDKVKDGTVTGTDLQEMQETLSGSSEFSKMSASSDNSDLSSFLKKVKNGTVSDSDLTAMKDKIAEMESQIGQKGGAPPKMGGKPPAGGPPAGGPPPGGPPPGGAPPAGAKEDTGSSIQGSSLTGISDQTESSSSSSEDEDDDELDANGDGTVSMEEYAAYYAKQNAKTISDNLKAAESEKTEETADAETTGNGQLLESS